MPVIERLVELFSGLSIAQLERVFELSTGVPTAMLERVVELPTIVPAAVLALAVAIALDLTVEEPPQRVHPVALFGRLVAIVDRQWQSPRPTGVFLAIGLPVLFAGLLAIPTALATRMDPTVGVIVAALAAFSTMSLGRLLSTTSLVVAQTSSDVDAARESIVALVGRDVRELGPAELRSGAVESLAENLADGFVAPLVGFALGAQLSLAWAIAFAAWVKGVNTLDSMLGYESKAVGEASARLDDLVMYLPARISAVCIAVAARDPRALRRAGKWARRPRSPNSGWPMATLAAVLDVELRKADGYVLNPTGDPPTVADAERGIRLVGVAGALAVAGAGLFTWAGSDQTVWSTLGVIPWS